MTAFVMGIPGCVAWIEIDANRHYCQLANDHSGFHVVVKDGREMLWSNR